MGVGLSASQFKGALELCEGTLEPGDSLIFYTDGLSEAQAPDDTFYGEDRLKVLLGRPAEDLQAAILADVDVLGPPGSSFRCLDHTSREGGQPPATWPVSVRG